MKSVVIAGAGLAAARCAETLRAHEFDGRLIVVGDEPVPPYERPALSKEFLLGTRTADDLLLRPDDFWPRKRIELLLDRRIVSVRPGVAVTCGGEILRWDAFVLATGARPRRLSIATPPGVHVLRTLADASALRRALVPGTRLVVIGGGFVGGEVASSARALGVEVTMIEAQRAPFAQMLGDDVADLLARRYRSGGIRLRTETVVASLGVRHNGALRSVQLADGSEVSCDVALLAIGVEPARELLRNGAHGSAHVCGDAAGRGHWTAAAADAVALGHRILGLDPPAPQPPFFWSDQFGLRLQLVGDPRSAAGLDLEGTDTSFVARYLDDDGRVVALLGANRPEEVGALRRELALVA